MLKIKDKIYC